MPTDSLSSFTACGLLGEDNGCCDTLRLSFRLSSLRFFLLFVFSLFFCSRVIGRHNLELRRINRAWNASLPLRRAEEEVRRRRAPFFESMLYPTARGISSCSLRCLSRMFEVYCERSLFVTAFGLYLLRGCPPSPSSTRVSSVAEGEEGGGIGEGEGAGGRQG